WDGSSAQLALDLGFVWVLRERTDIAPGEGEDGVAVKEVLPSLAQLPAKLRLLTRRGQLLQKFQRGYLARPVDQWVHRIGVKPVDVVGLGDFLGIAAGVGRDRERR